MRVVNIVLTAKLDKSFDLNEVKNRFYKSIYKPHRFSGLIMKIRKASVTLFGNGKLIILGCKSFKEGESVARKVGTKFQSCVSDVRTVNIVVNEKIDRLDLSKLYEKLKENNYKALYEPERFAAVVIYINGLSILVFHTGNINITGGNNLQTIEENLQFIKDFITNNHINFV